MLFITNNFESVSNEKSKFSIANFCFFLSKNNANSPKPRNRVKNPFYIPKLSQNTKNCKAIIAFASNPRIPPFRFGAAPFADASILRYALEANDMLMIYPRWAPGDFRGWERPAIVRAIEWVIAALVADGRVDPNRVYAIGKGDGALGAYYVSSCAPSLFAAIMAIETDISSRICAQHENTIHYLQPIGKCANALDNEMAIAMLRRKRDFRPKTVKWECVERQIAYRLHWIYIPKQELNGGEWLRVERRQQNVFDVKGSLNLRFFILFSAAVAPLSDATIFQNSEFRVFTIAEQRHSLRTLERSLKVSGDPFLGFSAAIAVTIK